MSRIQRLERLIQNAVVRLERAQNEVAKVRTELKELRQNLHDAQVEEQQLSLPFGQKARGLSEKWSAVLNFIVLRSPNPVSIDEILQFAAENSLDISRAAARAQVHNYVQRGILTRVSDGIYLPTDAAKVYCDF